MAGSVLNDVSAMLASLTDAEQIDSVLAFLSENLTPANVVALGSAAVLSCAVIEQIKYRWWRRGSEAKLPGPDYTVPFIGGIVDMVKDPHGFWSKQWAYCHSGLSWNSIVGKFMVTVTDPAIMRKVFNHNGEDSLLLELHPNAKMILGSRNIAFMHGPEHTALRKSFLPLFTRRALSTYVRKQDAIIRSTIKEWLSTPGPREMRLLTRDMNAATSRQVFIGPYLSDPAAQQKFQDAFIAMTEGFLAFPLKFPGTKVWAGYQGRLHLIRVLEKAAQQSKDRMAKGGEPDCLMDFWVQGIQEKCAECEAEGKPHPKYAHNTEIAYTVMDFLFASQDASTSSLIWVMTLMDQHPDVLERVRQEQMRLRPDLSATIDGEKLSEMSYTRQVVKEILRFRPPAPSVPQKAQRPFKLSETYTAPKGAFIVPWIDAACKQGYSNPDQFDPDRFSPERGEDQTYARNFLVFGHGPHMCVGKEYAVNHLMVFLAIFSTAVDWKRIRTKDSDQIKFLPTIYPADCIIDCKPFSAAVKA